MVETTESEAGKMPILCDLLMTGIFVYKKVYKSSQEFRIVPVGKVLNEYRTDYLVGVLEVGNSKH